MATTPMRPPRLLHEYLLQRGDGEMRHRTALLAQGRPETFGALLEAAQRFAGALRERGVGRGDRVALYLENSPTCAAAIYGTLIAGAVFVPVNPQTPAGKLAFILEDCGARALIGDGALRGKVEEALRELSAPPTVLYGGGESADGLDAVLAGVRPLAQAVPVIPLDLAAILYTSGSTGVPKGVMQTHQAMVFTLGSLIEYLRLGPQERIFCALPLSFDYGL